MKKTAIAAILVGAMSVIGVVPPAQAQAPAPAAAPAGNAETGKKLYTSHACYECHGYEGQGAPALAGPRIAPNPTPFRRFSTYLRAPTGDMPPYSPKALSDQQLADIYAYLQARPRPPAVRDVPQLAP